MHLFCAEPRMEGAPGITSLQKYFISNDRVAQSFAYAADGEGMKILRRTLALDLEHESPHLLGLMKEWKSYKQGRTTYFQVPGMGIIRTMKMARKYLAAASANPNAGDVKILVHSREMYKWTMSSTLIC